MTIRRLLETIEMEGEWNLPEQPHRRIAGRLSYTSSRSVLHLNESFKPLQGSISILDESPQYEVIHGTSTTGEAITILHALRIGVDINIGSGGFRQPERILAPWVIIGSQVPHDHLYPKVLFRIPGLETWLASPNIEQKLTHYADPKEITSEIKFGTKPAISIDIPAIQATLKLAIGYSSKANPFKSLAVEVSLWAYFEHQTPQSLDWHLEQYTKLTTMLAFIAGCPMPADCIKAAVDDSDHRVSVLLPLKITEICTRESPDEFFASKNCIGVELATVVARWYEEIPSFYIPSQLALGALASKDLWHHIEFLLLMQSLEGLHRSRFPGLYMDASEYEIVMQTIETAIPKTVSSDHRNSLRSRIRYGNQISLKKRIDSLVQLLDPQIARLVIGKDGRIPQSWIDTRNYYTHWDDELRQNILEGQALYFANVRMRHLLRVLYINFMGIPADAVIKCLRNSSSISQQILQLNLLDRQKDAPSERTGAIMTINEMSETGKDESID